MGVKKGRARKKKLDAAVAELMAGPKKGEVTHIHIYTQTKETPSDWRFAQLGLAPMAIAPLARSF